jgi:3-oxoacyl-[acyl-carrier-protein] synthase-3
MARAAVPASATVAAAVSAAPAAKRRTTRRDAAEVKPERPAGKLFRGSARTQSLMGVRIVGTGSYVPEQTVSNAELEGRYGFEPGWIEQRTGIVSRRYAAPGENTSDLCAEAARRAMRAARVAPEDIDLLVVGTFTPDYYCPSTACLVQDLLGLDAPAFDVQAACSGFVYALITAAQYVATGNSKLALVCGGDVNSRIVLPTEQRPAPLFGDGAGAVLVSRGEEDQGFVCYQMGADGSGGPLLTMPAGGTARPITSEAIAAGDQYLQMDGRNVFKWAIQALTESIEVVLAKSDMRPQDVSCYLLHQANVRIINNAAEQLGISPEKMFNNLQRYGNTSAASIPLALDEARREGRVRHGDTLLLSGFGAGLTWGTALFRW